jgi:muconolactone D-isomerase
MNYLVTATPTERLTGLTTDERAGLMAREREVASALIATGAITWMWRLPGTEASVSIWNAESDEELREHLEELPVFPYNDVEITALAAHPAFPTALRADRAAAGARQQDGLR